MYFVLLFYRLFGIAVVDYDISEGDDEDHDEQEQEDDGNYHIY